MYVTFVTFFFHGPPRTKQKQKKRASSELMVFTPGFGSELAIFLFCLGLLPLTSAIGSLLPLMSASIAYVGCRLLPLFLLLLAVIDVVADVNAPRALSAT
jgi:hypothetical protein